MYAANLIELEKLHNRKGLKFGYIFFGSNPLNKPTKNGNFVAVEKAQHSFEAGLTALQVTCVIPVFDWLCSD